MDATQQIDDSFCEGDTDEEKEQDEGKKGREPLAALKVLKNNYIPETEVPLYQGENVLGRDPACCLVPLEARSISSRHAVISISSFHDNDHRLGGGGAMEALLWDLGSLNGTRKGRIKLTPSVRYALTEGDSVVLADLPCQYISLKSTERKTNTASPKEKEKGPTPTRSGMGKGVENGGERSGLPPVPLWGDKEENQQSPQKTPKQPEQTLVPESDSDSEGENGGRKERRKFLASDSVSSELSSPTCSTFLTPGNKVIPESEDESSITPSSEVMGRFIKKADHGDSLKPAFLNFTLDSDTEHKKEEAEVSKKEPEAKAANPPQADPACLHMDSDTDVEDEAAEETKSPEISTVVPQKELVPPADHTMDSDTDVEDEATEETKSPEISTVIPQKELVPPADHTMVPPADHTMDSDTDVEDEATEETKSPEISTVVPQTKGATSAALTIDSDTDVEENEPAGTETGHLPESKEQKTSAELHNESDTDVEDEDVPVTTTLETPVPLPPANPVGELHMDSDTDAEEQEKPTEAMKLISDSETDDDDDPFKPTKSETVKKAEAPQAKTAQPDSDSDPHIDTEAAPDARGEGSARVQTPAGKAEGEFRMDSDTDVEDEEEKFEELPGPAAGIMQSSTPVGAGLPEEEMETQVFVSPSQPFKRPAVPSLLQSSVSQDSDDFTVAETQSFVSDPIAADATLDETRQSELGLSDSSHQQPDHEDPLEYDWAMEATQPYGRGPGDEPGQKQLDLEATQAYADDMSKEEEEEKTQPLKNDDTNGLPLTCERGGRVVEDDWEVVDSHPSTADTLILVRSPKLDEPTQPYALFTAQTLPLGGDEDDEEEEESSRTGPGLCKGGQIDEEQTQAMVPDANVQVAIAETLPMVEETQPPESDTDAHVIAETQPMGEGEEEREDEGSETTSSRKPGGGSETPQVEPTQPLELEADTHVDIAVTQPMGEEEEEEREEEQRSEIKAGRRPQRGRKGAKVEETQPLEPEAQPVGEDEEEPEEEKQGASKRPRRGRTAAKAEATQPLKPDATSNVSTTETPVEEEEEEEVQEEEQQTSRRSLRGKGKGVPGKGKARATAEKEGKRKRGRVVTEEEENSEEEAEGEKKGGGRKSTRHKSKQQEERDRLKLEEEERVRIEREEQEEQEEKDRLERERVEREDRERAERLEQERKENEDRERLKKEEEEGKRKEKEENERLERERKEKEAREMVERERKEREERERLEKEEEDRLAREKKEKEEKERIEKEEKERMEKEKKEREEKERRELEEKEKRELEEKEKRELEEKEKRELEEKEKRELEEKEKREREEKEKREAKEKRAREAKEKREREAKEKREKEELKQKLEKERKEQEEKDRLERERKEQEEKEQTEKEAREKAKREKKEKEQLEKETKKKDKKDTAGADKEEDSGRPKGKRRGGRLSKEKEQKEDEQVEDENGQIENSKRARLGKDNEPEDGKSEKKAQEKEEMDSKLLRGRRPTRKSTALPAGAEESASIAKRTRSRSNSSNSVSSELSTPSLEDRSRGRGRGRGRGSRPAEEVADNSRPPGRRKTATAASTTPEQDSGAWARSRSTSGSSERSSSRAGIGATARKGRKSVKADKQDEGSQGPTATVGRGRGRGGRRLEAGSVTVEATEEAQQEEEKSDTASVKDESVISQTSRRGRKRGADTTVPAAEAPQLTPKTPRRSLTGQAHKVLFTGVVDEDGEKVLMRLGGGLARGVGDMTHLVTDKVRRTVKFLCAVAKGVPIVTLDWLTKCGKAGTLLSPNEFLVKDAEQEKKFNFSLQDSLRAASRQPLLQGYEIHVTPSVKPEPSQMKDIITCCGARYLPKMPAAHKAQMVVVSCEEDRALCNKALSLAVPVVSAEFLLTGILQQKVDLKTHALSASPSAPSKPAAQGRRK